jgi:hypothetical protein
MAATLPFLLVQDIWRYLLIARGTPRSAALNDALWVAIQLVGTVYLLMHQHYIRSSAVWLLMWGVSGGVAAFVGAWQCRVIPRPDHVDRWWSTERRFMWRFFIESLIAMGWAPITLLILAALSGLDAAASVRGAQALFGPLFVVAAGLMTALLPEGVRVSREAPTRLSLVLVLASGAVAGAGVLLSVALVLAPSNVGSALLGASWPGTHKIILAYGIAIAASSFALGAATGMRILQAISISLRRRVASAPALFILPIVGAATGDVSDFAIGFLAAAVLQALILWSGFVKAVKEHDISLTT